MILALVAAAALQSQDAAGFWERDALLGDWGGVRRSLADRGLTTTLEFTGEFLGTVHGGVERDTGADLLLDWVVEADLDRMLGWTGGSAKLNPLWLAGDGVSDSLGDLTQVSNITGRGGVRVFELWLQQALFDGAISLRAGILAADQEFAITGQGQLYYNSVFGGPVFLTANLAWPIYPVGALGARVRVEPAPGLSVQAAVYDGNPGTEDANRSGLRVRLHSDEGVFTIAEIGWTSGGDCPGTVKAGGFHHSGGGTSSSSGLGGGYALYEQKIYREGPLPGALDAFVRVGFVPEEKARVAFGADAGLNFTGLLPGRPLDVLGVGFIYARISRTFALAQPEPATWGYESVIETTYRLAVTPAWSFQPCVQVVLHPGGSSRVPDATVVGVRVDLLF